MSLSSSDDDSQQRFALGFIFALITLIVATVIGTVVVQRGIVRAPKPAAAAATVSNAASAEDVARIVVQDGVVKFYFASGKSELAAGANEALADAVKAVLEGGKTLLISGFHDATGSADFNAELAKQRAVVVRDALLALSVPEDKIELKKPEQTQGDGSNAEARRVEVTPAP